MSPQILWSSDLVAATLDQDPDVDRRDISIARSVWSSRRRVNAAGVLFPLPYGRYGVQQVPVWHPDQYPEIRSWFQDGQSTGPTRSVAYLSTSQIAAHLDVPEDRVQKWVERYLQDPLSPFPAPDIEVVRNARSRARGWLARRVPRIRVWAQPKLVASPSEEMSAEELVRLHEDTRLTWVEIARRAGTTKGAVRARYYRHRQQR